MSIVAKQLDGSRCQLVHKLDGDPAPPPKGAPTIFGPCLLWPNGHLSQLQLSSLQEIGLGNVSEMTYFVWSGNKQCNWAQFSFMWSPATLLCSLSVVVVAVSWHLTVLSVMQMIHTVNAATFSWCICDLFIMDALCNSAGHCVFALWFLSSSFFPRLTSAATDWMSTIFPHMVWP